MDVNICYRSTMSTMTLLPVIDAAACCAPLTRDPLTQAQADDLAKSLKALADPARLRLISIIAASEGQEACVCDLTDALLVGQPTVSHHLKVLTEAGYVTRSKRGSWAYYALVPGALDAVSRLLVTD
jgi:ArsR family transcriptional regulator, arsenate/arsenite/antimonite-responsive transcriptional repressor